MAKNAQIDDLLLIVGQTLSQISDRMVQLGLIWFITSRFGESFLIWYLVVGGLPHVLLVKYSSVVIDHLSALKTVLFSDLARGLVYLFAFVFITMFPEWLLEGSSGSHVLWLLFISVFVSNIFSAFFNPAIMSLSVEIKSEDQIQKLTAKLSSVTSFATIIGPIFGLFVFDRFGLGGLFIVACASYLLSALSVSMVTKPKSLNSSIEPSKTIDSDFSIFGSKTIIGVMLAVFLLMNLMLSPLQILMPSMAKDLFGNSFNSLAILETVIGLGVLLGGATLSVYTIVKRQLFWTWIFLLLIGFSFLSFTSSTLFGASGISLMGATYKVGFLAATVALLALGFFLGLANVLIINILQTQPSPRHVSKVMSYVNLISTAALPFSLALLGFLQQSTSIYLLGQIAGVFLVVIAISSFFPFRRFGQEIFK